MFQFGCSESNYVFHCYELLVKQRKKNHDNNDTQLRVDYVLKDFYLKFRCLEEAVQCLIPFGLIILKKKTSCPPFKQISDTQIDQVQLNV